MNAVAEAYHWIDLGPEAVSVELASVLSRPVALEGDALESAVYAHIQALRGLGKTKTNTAEIARALGLSVLEVERVIGRLIEKDVRVIPA